MALAAGQRLGPYEILASLGGGGMGEVYRARDTRLEREVAIKVVRERFAKDAQAVARFHREAQAAAALSHPNVVAIHDYGMEGGNCFAVMELLEGQTLGKRLESGPLPIGEMLEIALGVALGLEAAHERGIIHRDIKPENVFLTNAGGVKILDFGLARLKTPTSASRAPQESGTTTEPGMLMGTVCYMSPEQARGLPVDARSDLFSFGCVLYEMATGRRPFQRASGADTLSAILNETPPPLGAGQARPAGLDRVIGRCLEKNPDARYASAHEVVQALRALLQQSAMGETWLVSPAHAATTTATAMLMPEKRAPRASLAVLPFLNMSPDRDNEYFSDGLAEELIHVLSRLDGLHVASRTSSFAFKGKNEDIRKIGEELNVASILEGSVRKAGNRLRISARLVNAADGFQLWAETYDRQLEDIFQIQTDIAQSIATALRLIFSDTEKRALEKAQPANVAAYDFYLRGMQFFHQFRRKGFEFARQMFSKAIEIDPGYARAYAGLAYCHSVLHTNWDKSDVHVTEADAASRKALELGSDLAEAHAARGMAVMLTERYEEARQEFETAIRLNPNLFEAYFFYARSCVAQGRLEDAARLFEEASQLRPEDYQAPLLGASVLSGLSRKAEAEACYRRGLQAAEKHLEQHPDDARAYYLGANAWSQLGQPQRGLEWAQRALDLDPQEPLTLYNVACVYALEGKLDAAIDCLEKAVQHGFRHKAWIEHDADLAACRCQPRFQALLERLAPIAAAGAG
ncbi:MAG: protein kinase [Gemmataceae bacterium]